jgi:hypothetical protein
MTEYEITTLSLIVKPKGERIYSDFATIVEMMDEVGGPFVRILQHNESTERGEIRIDPDEWGTIMRAVDMMLAICLKEQSDMNIKEGKSK